MDWLTNLIWYDGKFLGIQWSAWKVVGWVGNAIFFSRFFVQWYVTEKKKQVVVPVAFWWLSLSGSLTLLLYALYKGDSVFIWAYLFPWLPYIRNIVIHYRHQDAHIYIRNIVIHYRHQDAHIDCPSCAASCAPKSRFCSACGAPLTPAGQAAKV
jgi:lipid-A-disaccharide synthase-like uncharacterized protein